MNDLIKRLSSTNPLKRDAQDAVVELKRLQQRVKELEQSQNSNFKQGFAQGIIWACARINEIHDRPVIANDILSEAGINNDDYKLAQEYDLKFLRPENSRIPKGKE